MKIKLLVILLMFKITVNSQDFDNLIKFNDSLWSKINSKFNIDSLSPIILRDSFYKTQNFYCLFSPDLNEIKIWNSKINSSYSTYNSIYKFNKNKYKIYIENYIFDISNYNLNIDTLERVFDGCNLSKNNRYYIFRSSKFICFSIINIQLLGSSKNRKNEIKKEIVLEYKKIFK